MNAILQTASRAAQVVRWIGIAATYLATFLLGWIGALVIISLQDAQCKTAVVSWAQRVASLIF